MLQAWLNKGLLCLIHIYGQILSRLSDFLGAINLQLWETEIVFAKVEMSHGVSLQIHSGVCFKDTDFNYYFYYYYYYY